MEQTTASPPPPPPPPVSSAPARPPLRRRRDGRWIAGVANGLAGHLGIDPVIIRIVFVALVFFGGSGFAVYGLAWLLIPEAGEERSLAQRWTRDVDGRWRTAGIAAVVLGGVLLAGAIGSGELIVPLLLLAAGGWLLVRSDDGSTPFGGPPAEQGPPPPAPQPTTSAAAASVARDATDPGPSTWVDPTARTVPAAEPVDLEPSRPEQRSSVITPLVLALVLLICGVAVLAAQVDAFAVSATATMAISLTVVGLGLLASVRWGRARGLIPLGLVLAAGVGIASLVDFPLWSGIGERVVPVEDATRLEEPIRHGLGAMEVDLSDLDLDGRTEDLEVGLSIGELVVVVPRDVDVEFTGEVSAGEIRVFQPERFDGADRLEPVGDERSVDGIDRTLRASRDGADPENGTLVIDAQVGFGELRVEVADT